MKRMGLLAITLLLFALSGIIVVAQMPGETEELPVLAEKRLGQFLVGETWSGQATVERVARARKPWLFVDDWGSSGSGDGPHFRTAGEAPLLGALRFPPDQLWCVLLKRTEAARGDEPYAVVLVGLHLDMYNADWVVHQATDAISSSDLLEALSTLGCDLELEEVGPRRVEL